MANETKLEWNVYDYNYCNRELRIFNVFHHGSFTPAVKNSLKWISAKRSLPNCSDDRYSITIGQKPSGSAL